MTPTRKEVVRVARECGAFLELSTTPEKDMAFLLRFAERFYEAGAAEAREPLVEALQPFVLANSSEEYITLVVRTDDVTKARAAIAKATGEKA